MKQKVNKFACTGCGMCCKFVREALASIETTPEPYKTELKKFPYKAKEDGSCENLTDDKKCKIYEIRPLLCRIEEMYEEYKKSYFKTDWKAHCYMQAKSCNKLMDRANISQELRVNENQYK